MAPLATCPYSPTETTAYLRLGFYYELRDKGKWFNFCDYHRVWSGYASARNSPLSDFKYYFTGPKDSVNGIKSWDRDRIYRSVFNQNHADQMSAMDIDMGGIGYMVGRKKRHTHDCWLFGPIRFDGVVYGTLLVEIQGFHDAIVYTRYVPVGSPVPPGWRESDGDEGARMKGNPDKLQYRLVFSPRNAHFQPCTIYGADFTDYPLGAQIAHKKGWTPIDFLNHQDEIYKVRESMTPLSLPRFAKGAVWRQEAASDGTTFCDATDAHDETVGWPQR